jgi:hypothetical protein
MLVAVFDAGVGRTAGLGTAPGLDSTGRLEGTTGLELAAANTFRCCTAGISLATMVAKTRVGERADGKRQGDSKAAEKQRTTHELSLQKKSWQ